MSDAEAKVLLSDFVVNDASTRSGEIVEVGDYTVKSYNIAPKGSKTETIPVFHYKLSTGKEEGYALVVADNRISKVLAYVEKGSLADTSFIEPLRLYVRTIPEFIASELTDYYEGNSKIAIPVTKVESVITHYCFLPTIWSQKYPYNSQCPLSSCSAPDYNGRSPAGCVAIAIAQILAYHHVPSSLSWSSILASPILTGSSSSTVINQWEPLLPTSAHWFIWIMIVTQVVHIVLMPPLLCHPMDCHLGHINLFLFLLSRVVCRIAAQFI